MATDTTGDTSLIQDEDLRKTWQETDDFDKKKEIRSHMYKVREARLKDFHNTGEESTSVSENRSRVSTTTTTRADGSTVLKGSDLTTHADNLADHSFLSLKSKEIRDSESPTKDSYKIIETRKINDRDWNVLESNETSKDGKSHTTSRIATTSGRQDLDGGESKYAAKSEQKATVYKDGDDKNFTKAVEASSRNVIAQEASGGDDNSKFYTSSTTTTSSSKYSSEQRSVSGDAAYEPINLKESMISTVDKNVTDNSAERNVKYGDHPVIRKVYTENVPNELKNNPNYIDGKTKVTTETKTLPDGSTLTTTRYETKGATQYSTATSASSRHVSSSSNEQRTSDNLVKTHLTTSEDLHQRDFDDRSTRSNSISSDTAVKIDKKQSIDSKSVINRSNLSDVTYHDEDIRRSRDIELIGRDAKDGKTVRNIEIIKKGSVPERVTTTTTTVTKTINSGYEKEPKQSGTPGSNIETLFETRDIPSRENRTVTSTTVAKNFDTARPDSKTTTSTIVTKSYTVPIEDTDTTETSTTVTKKISTNYDKQQVLSTDFLDTERTHEVQTRNSTSPAENSPKQIEPVNKHTTTETEYVIRKGTVTADNKQIFRDEYPREGELKPALETVEINIIPIRAPSEKYDQPERRHPIKPGKSELDQKPIPTDGQYDTTYRTDYIPKRISVDVSPTHDAFARSLRSVSPDRVSKTGSTKSLRTISSTSVRSTSSPERFPTKTHRGFPTDSTTAASPARKTSKSPEVTMKTRPGSPEKKSPQRTIDTAIKKQNATTTTKTTTTAKDKRTEVDSNTLTKSIRPGKKPRSRSTSPTSIASDIEFIRHDVEPTTDLDDADKNITEDIRLLRRHTEEFNKRPSLEDTSAKKPQKIVDKSATSPLTDLVPQRNSTSPVKPAEKSTPKAIRRTDTYEERCKEILGISDNKEVPRKQTQPGSSPTSDPNERKTKPDNAVVQEFPSQIRRSPQKEPGLEKTKDNKKPSAVQELPSQKRKSPQRKPLEPVGKEFPSQLKKSPQKEPASPEKPRYDKKPSSVQEFPSQIRKSPQKERLEPYPGKPKDNKKPSSVQEFPSQIRRSPQKELLEPYPEKPKDSKKPSSVQEFPSQIRKLSPRRPLELYPEKPKDAKKPSTVHEFPSQIRRSPQKEPLEPYPEKPKHDKKAPTVHEFPSQVRKPSQREPLEPYPEKTKDAKKPPSVQEFPSHIRKSPQKELLEPYTEKPKDDKRAPTVHEFPSQVRKPSQREPLEPYPEKTKDAKKPSSVQEFPSQIRKSPQKEPLEPYSEKPKDDKKAPTVQEFPSQARKPSQREPLEPYPEKSKDDAKKPSSVQEFPSQIRKSPQKELLEPYPEKPKDDKKPSSVQEFPSQIRKTPQNELVESYPGTVTIDSKTKPSPRQITEHTEVVDREDSDDDDTRLVSSDDDEPLRKGPNKVSLDDLPNMKTEKVSLDDIPAYTRKSAKKSPEKVRLDDLRRSDVIVDGFIASEKIDTDITLKKYKDESIHKIRGISSDITSRTRKSKVTTSIKTEETESTDSTTEDEDVDDTLESQIIEDINAVVERTDTTAIKEIQPTRKGPKIGDEEPRDGLKPKTARSSQPQIEDFITITKTQLLQSGSKVPIEEPMHTKKFISLLAKEEEEDRRRQKQTSRNTKVISPDNKQVQKPNKIVKKDVTPRTPDQRNQIEIVVKNQKLDVVVKPKVGSIRRPEPKLTTKRIPDEKTVGRTEYADQYTTKTTDKRVSKPVTSKVSAKITLHTPTRQETKKTVQVRDTSLQKKGVSATKITYIDGKPKVPSTQLKQPTKMKPTDTRQSRIKTTAITRTTVEVQPVRRHVVSTIINIKPKNKPETITKTIHRTTATKTILAPKMKISKGKPKPVMNGHVSTDEDDSDIEIVEEITPRTSLKTTPKDRASPIKKSPMPKSIEATSERRKKCITTKSILIENAVADQREIIVDLKRSKSSREGTPDRICPYPVSIESDLGIARYPDRVMEPDDDGRRSKPKRISDVPLDEAVDVTQFNRIREIEEVGVKPTKTKVETTSDECLLSVNEKVNKFLNTAEQITRKPAPKVERPKLEVDDSLKEDECLLSVSDKVHKFITTAELLAAGTKETIHRSKSPMYKEPKGVPDDQDEIPPPKRTATPVSELIEAKTTVTSERPTTYRTTAETRGNIPVKLSVSPERKFPSTPTSRQEKSPERIQRGTPERKAPETDSNVHRTPEKGPQTERTPERKFSDSYLKKSTQEIVKLRRESFEEDGTPKTSRRLSKDDPNTVPTPTGRLRSTETVKKAKAIFENIGKETETTRTRDVLSRSSVFEGKKSKSERIDENLKMRDVRTRLTYDEVKRSPSPNKEAYAESKPRHRSPEPEEIPHYMTPLDRTVREQHQREKDVPSDGEIEEFDRSRESSPDRNVPHYMLPLDRSLRERSPHKENVKQLEDIMNRSITTTCSDETEVKTTKFGVTLKRTDSGRMTTVPRKSSTSSVDDRPRTEFEIEEIFDLEYLEKLLETIVGYDIRKRIRTQIRIIKRAIEENTLETLIVSRLGPTKRQSPEKRKSADKDDQISRTGQHSSTYERRRQTERETKETSEYQSSYRRDSFSEYTTTTKSPSPTRNRKEPSPKRKDKSRTPERRTLNTDEVDTKTITTTTKTFQTDLRRVKPTTKPVSGDKPEWMTQKTLRKVSESGAPVKKTQTTTTTVQKTVTTKGETQPTDVITSSYGVGPTDENGTPLFGLKALRAQNKSEKTKVQGTVIRSQFYSENGEEPEGEITVTKFSTDPEELGVENVTKEKGISSVTTTQKFGYKGTPSLKSITSSKNKKTSEVDVESKSSLKSSKITRRGSVKEISQKFIENAVDTLKSERQSSYPKAGLILRTSSFKDTPVKGSDGRRSKEGSPATQEVRQKIVTSVETTSTTSDNKKTNTFLTDKSSVTGVQDVISRMKNEAEIEVDETEEDAEARNLLNKFIGSQVLLAGMESHVSKSPVTALTASPENVKRTIKITTSTSSAESSKPTIITRTFTHPITSELLQDVWDEQTLKLLLEQSTDYEDRRIIRARLREVMAEQEACAELVEKASDEAATKESGSTVHEEAVGNGNVHDTDTEEERDEDDEEEEEDEEEEDDQATVKTAVHQEIAAETSERRTTIQPQPDLIMQTNPIYNRSTDEPDDNANNNSDKDDDYPAQLNEKANRFNSKKLKMKRANTIDIPKPLRYYECDEDDSDDEDWTNRRNSYLALRGPIRVGKSNPEKKVPEFEPKTESDRKFVAFLGKHSEHNPSENDRPKSLWCNRQQDRTVGNYVNNWSNKFGNMKSNFEKIQVTGGGNNGGVNSARNFWKSADDAVTAGRVSQLGPKISRQSAKNLQEMFEEKRKQSHQRQTSSNNVGVVTGHLKLDATGGTDKSVSVVVTQPNSFNKFSHAPMSAFKPLSKKPDVSTQQPPPAKIQTISYSKSKSLNIPEGTNETPETPLYLYSPKVSPQNVSPAHATTPWQQRKASGESRVLSIAASKFQNVQQEKERPPPPRRMSKEKIAIPPGLISQQIQPRETLSAPYLVRSFARENSVRKLSGQYDGLGNRDVDVPSSHDTKTRTFVPGENYTIQYDNPVVSKPQPKVYNAEYTITQQHYNLPSVRPDGDYRQESEPQTRFNQQIQRAPQIYDEKPRIHNQPRQQSIDDQDQHYKRQSQSYDYRDNRYEPHGITDHNQQQQMYVKMQQPPLNTDRFVDPSGTRQPKVFNEPDKSENDQQYTSNYQFKPQIQINPAQKTTREKIDEDAYSYDGLRQEVDRQVIKRVSEVTNLNKQHEYKRQTSQEGVQEYHPVSSKVMSGPVSQQAVTVQQNAPKSRDQHDMEYNLKATLQKFSSQSDYRKEPRISPKSSPERRTSTVNETNPPLVVYNNVKQRPSLCVNDKPLSLESLEINERGESVLTSRFHIPLRQPKISSGGSGHELSKSESWHQICQNSQTVNKPSPRASPNSRAVTRSKSSHTLAVPKQFEAGMTKSEMVEKKRTMEAYFGSAQNAMQKSETKKANSSSINRVKTSQKVSTQQRQNSNSGLCRSKTLPDIVCLDKLDDSNIDAIFEDLFNAKSTTRTTTFTEGPVTTTSQVTTRVTAQEPVKKPMSPFAKFRQLDKQNSLNSPPSTPKSPTSGGPLFKFTDPSLNQSANTVKQRLLQWCQMKTKEYENIQLDNFSTSWADGMAFCALIHHFLPDAFDFYALSPRNRRHNFTLAFRVADEKAGIAPLLDVDDMVAISRPDWKCVFTYVQSIYRRFKDED